MMRHWYGWGSGLIGGWIVPSAMISFWGLGVWFTLILIQRMRAQVYEVSGDQPATDEIAGEKPH